MSFYKILNSTVHKKKTTLFLALMYCIALIWEMVGGDLGVAELHLATAFTTVQTF